jgi:flagellar hook protein FlgE
MAFQTSLSGLAASQTNLSVTGNNIANASTTGFKKSRAEFSDVYASSIYGSASTAIGGGVRVSDVAQQFGQGNIEFTDNPLDLAVSGEGFFRLNDNGSILFSRAGMFGVDQNGFLVNSTSQHLTGYLATPTGAITGQLADLQIDTSNIAPSPTGTLTANGGISANLNLNANAAIIPRPAAPTYGITRTDPTTFTSSTSLTSYDSLGNPVLTTMYFTKRGANAWDVHTWLSYTDSSGNVTEMEVPPQGSTAATSPELRYATVTFIADGSLGTLTPPGGAGTYVDLDPSNLIDTTGAAISLGTVTGANDLDFEIDFLGSTQYGSPFSVNALTQDGYTTGQLSGVDIGETGIVFARYTNGQSRALGQVALANFANQQGLQPLGDTLWAETFDSGQPLVGPPGSSSLGLIQSGALESSNVDISKQLVNMIVAQRDFQANAKMISTEDAITQTIINIR